MMQLNNQGSKLSTLMNAHGHSVDSYVDYASSFPILIFLKGKLVQNGVNFDKQYKQNPIESCPLHEYHL